MARLKGFKRLTSVDKALSTLLTELRLEKLPSVRVLLLEALGRVLSESARAENDLPSFNRSAVDGYALRAEDTFEASQVNPKVLKLSGEDQIDEGKARQIWTGNLLPIGTNAVVMLEHIKRVKGGIQIWSPTTPGLNVSKRGEDVQKGEVAVKEGTLLRPQHLGLLAALGKVYVNVVKKPIVAILSTGSELVELGCKPKLGQVIDVNRIILSGLCMELGADTLDLGSAKDDLYEVKTKIQEGLDKADVVITTGGTSVGYADLVPEAIKQIAAAKVIVHGIAMRPAMPTALAILKGKPIVALSGNPVASMIGFEVFTRPLILKLLGIKSEPRPVLKARLTRRIPSVLGRRVYLRVYTYERNGEFFAKPVRIKGSGVLTTMTKANGYVVIPENREGLVESETVVVHLFDSFGGDQLV